MLHSSVRSLILVTILTVVPIVAIGHEDHDGSFADTFVIPPEMEAFNEKVRNDIREKGFVDLSTKLAEMPKGADIPHVEYILSRVEMVESIGLKEVRSQYPELNSADISFYDISEFDKSKLARPFSKILDTVIRPGSRNLIFPGNPKKLQRIYTKTKYGALLVEDFYGAEIDAPLGAGNIDLGGFPAFLSVLKYADDKWVTILTVAHSEGVTMVQSSDTYPYDVNKLSGFIDTVRSLVTHTE